jgi:hypothetical protein
VISIYPFQTREVRDLAWACFSPPLLHSAGLAGAGENLSNCALGLTDARRAWLERLDRDPGPLLAHLAERPGARLGIYFERLWHFFLAEDPAVDLLAHNLPVREGGRTIGEFDCLYYCRDRRRPVHLELAVKYYLGYRDDALRGAGAWLGPDSRDRLDLKVAHLMGSQIRLGDHPAAKAELQRLGIAGLAKEVEIKGDLFQPRYAPLPPPRGFNRDRRFSYWLRCAGLAEHLNSMDCNRFFVLPRLSWLAPSVTPPEECDNRDNLLRRLDRHFSVHRQPQLVASLGPDGRECERFFVTDSRWPDRQEP